MRTNKRLLIYSPEMEQEDIEPVEEEVEDEVAEQDNTFISSKRYSLYDENEKEVPVEIIQTPLKLTTFRSFVN